MRFVRSSRCAVVSLRGSVGRRPVAPAQVPVLASAGRFVALATQADTSAPGHCVGEMFGACVMIATFLALALFGVA